MRKTFCFCICLGFQCVNCGLPHFPNPKLNSNYIWSPPSSPNSDCEDFYFCGLGPPNQNSWLRLWPLLIILSSYVHKCSVVDMRIKSLPISFQVMAEFFRGDFAFITAKDFYFFCWFIVKENMIK